MIDRTLLAPTPVKKKTKTRLATRRSQSQAIAESAAPNGKRKACFATPAQRVKRRSKHGGAPAAPRGPRGGGPSAAGAQPPNPGAAGRPYTRRGAAADRRAPGWAHSGGRRRRGIA